MQRHNGREQFHGDRQGTKSALKTNPDQGDGRPPRTERLGLHTAPCPETADPGADRQYGNQGANRCSQVAVNHLHPGLALRYRAIGHHTLCGRNRGRGTQGAGVAIATRPVRATESRVGQAREGTKQDQIKGKKERQQGERLCPVRCSGVALPIPDPEQRRNRQQRTEQQDAQQRREVKQGLGVHAIDASGQANPRMQRRAAGVPGRAWPCWQRPHQTAPESASWCCPWDRPQR